MRIKKLQEQQISVSHIIENDGLLILGLSLGIITFINYFFHGYSLIILIHWLISIGLTGLYFYHQEKNNIKKVKVFDKKDWLYLAGLFLMFIPLYLLFSYTIPLQINTDEINVVATVRHFANQENIDLFGLSYYFGFPNLIFIVWGWLGKFIGGIDLFHIRLINASSGLIIIVLSYLFFRILSLPKIYAAGGAILMGSQHVLLAISRMGLRDNTPLLIELLAFALWYLARRYQSLSYTFLGGVVAGFSFYTYFPARIIVAVWIVFTIASYFFIWPQKQKQEALKFILVLLIGFFMVAMPVILATLKTPSSLSFGYQKQQFVIFKEGRELQQQWTSAETDARSVVINMKNGLLMFMKNSHDQGYMYANYGHGFVDPATRIFLLMGMVIIIIRLLPKSRSKTREQDLLMFLSFLCIWLVLALFTTKNPQYTRLLIILPFLIYLVLLSIREVISIFLKLLRRFSRIKESTIKRYGFYLFFLLIIVIAFWNVAIYKDYVLFGFKEGHDVGDTGRYMELRKNIPNYTFILAADYQYPYFSYGGNDYGMTWINFFTTDNQISQRIEARDLFSKEIVSRICLRRPFTLFLSHTLYSQIKNNLGASCRTYQVYYIKPDGSLLAVEIN